MWTVLMECRSLQESVESTPHSRPGCGRFFIASAIAMPKQCSCPECGMAHSIEHQYGTMLPLSERRLLEAPLMSFSAASRNCARISALQELEQAWQASEAGLCLNSLDSLASADLSSYSWKTSQLSLFGGLTEFSWSSMRSGMMRDGQLYQPQKWEPRTSENESGFLPTPTATPTATPYGSNQSPSSGAAVRPSLDQMARTGVWIGTPTATMTERSEEFSMGRTPSPAEFVRMWPTPTANDSKNTGGGQAVNTRKNPGVAVIVGAENGGQLNPQWVEWLMGFPIAWTELSASETAWFRSQRGKRSRDSADLKGEHNET